MSGIGLNPRQENILIVTYLRSSSYGAHELCEMNYFINYCMGWGGGAGLKAEKGTIVHKALEIIAFIKLCQQNGEPIYNDDILGEIDIFDYDVDDITERCYEHYSSHSQNAWKPLDLKHCKKWVHMTLDYNGGEYDPRNCEIVQPEQAFDFEIKQDWAKYDYEMPDGTIETGYLSLKGTIDQISKIDDNTYQILDFKTGKRLNWRTGQEKSYEDLCKDPQLMLYYYAIQTLYPEIDNFEVVIYFINDGGPFRICFSKVDIPRIEGIIREKFEQIKNREKPQLTMGSTFCRFVCYFGKNTFKGTHVKPIIEQREGQVTPKGKPMSMCEQTRYCLKHRNTNDVLKNMSAPDFNISYYRAPGSVDKKEE